MSQDLFTFQNLLIGLLRRGIVQINLHQNHQSVEKSKQRQNTSCHPRNQSFQQVIMIQLEYQSDRGKKANRYQDVSIVMRLYL